MTMKKILILLLATMALMTSCNETVNMEEQRRYENEQAFKPYTTNKDYTAVSVPGFFGSSNVYMKWETRGTGTDRPKATDYVRMQYSGYLLTSWTTDGKSGRFEDNLSEPVAEAKAVYRPQIGQVPGLAIALQSMVEGDKATIIVPWYLGYGAVGYTRQYRQIVPSYSALVYEVTLMEILGDSYE